MVNDQNKITIAIPSGRLRKKCIDLLERCGLISIETGGRKLMWENHSLKIIEVKPIDVPVYVENGVADCGFIGKDVLLEHKPNVYELLDCQFGSCVLALAQMSDEVGSRITGIASKYQNIAREYCQANNLDVPVIPLNGSVELAPQVGLANTILDIVDTGETMRANGLEQIEVLTTITVRFIANKASYQLARGPLDDIIQRIQAEIEGGVQNV